jgi:hypothetical protein
VINTYILIITDSLFVRVLSCRAKDILVPFSVVPEISFIQGNEPR